MNFFQRLILLVGTVALFLCCLVPPWKETVNYRAGTAADRASYYARFWKPPQWNTQDVTVDGVRLATQLAGVVGTTTGLVLVFSSGRRWD